MLTAHDVSFCYGSAKILDGVSIELRVGSLVGIVGPNGAGKSTLLHCLYGSLRPNIGVVQLGDRDVLSLTRREVAQSIGVVPQQYRPVFPVSVEHFVGLGRFAHGRWFESASGGDREAVERAMANMGITHLATRCIQRLSGGEFRRALIAQALAQEPRFLLFDEPLQQLDLRHQLEVLEFARTFAQRPGSAAVVVLHDLSYAARYCDSLLLLDHGRTVASGTPGEVLTEATVAEVFEVRASIGLHPAIAALNVVPIEPAKHRATTNT